MKPAKILVFVFGILFPLQAECQQYSDSVRILEPVVVMQSRLNDFVIASYSLPIDSSVLSLASTGSVTDLLRKQGFGHIRSYGAGGLATPSFRGTGGSHTAVLWNGISLVSPLSGQLDLSLMPVGLFEDASIQTGGSTSLSGNGSIGASIHLNNNVKFNEGSRLSLASYIGSFGNYFNDIGFRYSNTKFGSSTKIFYSQSENDFKFTNNNLSPAKTQRREHSASRQGGLLQQLNWNASEFGIFSLKLWYQKSRYEIPNPTTISRISQAVEENEFYRTLFSWSYSKEKFELYYQGAFLRQALNYSDPEKDEYSTSIFNSTIHNFESSLNFKRDMSLTLGVHYTWEQGIVDEFGAGTPVRNRVAFFSAFKINPIDKLKLALSVREELVNGGTTPVTPTVSIKYIANNSLEVFTNLSRNYRLPTFNDLYWKGSGARGNPLLKPEVSLGGEVGVTFIKTFATMKAVVFSNHVDDWISWSPTSEQTYVPQNIKKVWARGIETQLMLHKKLNKTDARITGQYSYTLSTNESIYQNGNQAEKGKQLILTPRHEGSITGEVLWNKYSFRIVESFTGKQFNDSDNSPYNILPSYAITNLWVSKKVDTKWVEFSIIVEVNNILNVEYQGRPGYPLPGINYKAGIQINLNKSNNI